MDDEKIIDLYWQRSQDALAATQQKYGSYCHAIARNILHDHQDAEECVNDALMRAWNAIPPQRPRHLPVFLGTITRNLALDKYREAGRRKRGGGEAGLALSELSECIASQDSVEQAIDEQELSASISRFLRALPEQKRNMFIRRYWYLYSADDIAGQYGVSKNKVAVTLFRIRKALKEHLGKDGIAL